MRAVLKAGAIRNRTVWAADSFAAEAQLARGWSAANVQDRVHELSTPATSVEEVKLNFARYNLLDEQVRFLVGQFHDTLPTAPIDRISILRLAGASYEATMVALQALYPRLSIGGYIIIDDYGAVTSSRRATDDFRGDHGLTEPIQWVDWSGAFWQKSE